MLGKLVLGAIIALAMVVSVNAMDAVQLSGTSFEKMGIGSIYSPERILFLDPGPGMSEQQEAFLGYNNYSPGFPGYKKNAKLGLETIADMQFDPATGMPVSADLPSLADQVSAYVNAHPNAYA